MKPICSFFFLMPLTIGALLMDVRPVAAAPIVHQVSQSQAQGLTGNGATVTVWAGSGSNIDFTRTGETIQRAWLDDPHAIVVDFDAPLNGRTGASILHLKRITGVHFPNLPKTKSTLLTVVTASPYGKKTYLFEIRYGSGTSQYATIAVTPDAEAVGRLTLNHDRANWSTVERGLQRAISRQLFSATSPLVLRVQNFLALVRNGMPMQSAAERAKVSLSVISKLAELGTPSSLPTRSLQ